MLLEKMNADTLLVFFVAAILLQSNNVYAFGNRIVNGSTTPENTFEFIPRLVPLFQGHGLQKSIETELCSSTIISNRHVLTAAHCVNLELFDKKTHTQALIIHAAAVFVSQRAYHKKSLGFAGVSLQPRYYFHPSYNTFNTFKSESYDVAIIEFPEDTNWNITPVILASDFVEKDGDMAIVAGYGINKWTEDPFKNGTFPQELQNATVHLRSNCSDFSPAMICTSKKDVHVWQGDSGGPLMIERNGKHYQVGIVSGSIPMHDGPSYNSTGMYTRISFHCDWISMVTKGLAKCESLNDGPKTTSLATLAPNPASTKPNSTTTTSTSSPSTPQSSSSSQPLSSTAAHPSELNPSTATKIVEATTTMFSNEPVTGNKLQSDNTTGKQPNSSVHITINILFVLIGILIFS